MNARFEINADDLSERLANATEADTCKGMFFNGLFRAVESLGPAQFAAFKDRAQGRKYVDFFNYTLLEFLPLAYFAAELVGGGRTPAQLESGIRTLGRQATDDFVNTAVGKTLMLLANHDARRLMPSLATGYKTAVSYGTRTLTWSSRTAGIFAMRRDLMPHPYHEGVLIQVLTAVGAKDVRVVGTRLALFDTDYDFSWS